jgi:hypothetical protein
MTNQNANFTHFAILIEINAYQNKPLKSCVQNVESIKTYLERLSKSIHIQLFTTSVSFISELSNPSEDPVLLSTYNNVTDAFEKINSLAKEGGFVYIHYSGHDIRQQPDLDDEFFNKTTEDLTLILLDEGNEDHARYL